MEIIWPEFRFNLIPKGNVVWNVQKIILDDFSSWDENLELILLKEKLGLVQFFSMSCKDENILHPLVSYRRGILLGLIAKKQLY